MTSVAEHLTPPYYAAIMPAAEHASADESPAPAERLAALAMRHPDFLGLETARTVTGAAVTVSYWRSMEAIEEWQAAGRAAGGHPNARDPQPAPADAEETVTVARIDRPGRAAPAIRGITFEESRRTAWSFG